MMQDTLQIMVLPTTVADGMPQVFFDDCGIWRETSTLLVPQTARQEVETFLSDVMRQVGQTPPTPFPAATMAFRSRFTGLLRTLLAPEVRDTMKRSADEAELARSTRPQLNVFFRGSTEWIPWELLHDGTNYVGVRYAVSRLPIVPQAIQVHPPRNQLVRKVYNLLARGILQDPDRADWQSTFAPYASLNPGGECRFPTNGNDDYPTLAKLDEAKGADVIHITCHGGMKDSGQNEFFWTLDHRNPSYFDYRITTGVAQAAEFSQRPLVFGNACVSAAAQSTDLTALQGFGSSFMVGGALNFVGTFAPITKTMAVAFAKRFYARLFGSPGQPALPIGEALRATKESFSAENCPDPSYLFYCLYGPCDSTYKP
jgi:hypothetical protein